MRITLTTAAVAALAAGLAANSARADLEIVSITPRAHGSSVLNTTLGAQSFLDTITAGTYPSFIGSLPGALTSGTSNVQCAADYTLFMTNTQIIANGFADSSVTAGAGFLGGSSIAESSIEIVFNIDGPHHVELHSIESQSSNAGGAAVLTHNDGPDSHEVFRYEHNHVHGVVYNLEAGNYTLLLNADTASDFATGGAQSVAFYEIEFELFEGPACRCDLNADNQVDDADFVVFAAAYNDLICPPPPAPGGFTDRHAGCPADFDGNSVVDDADFVIFAQAYNELVCP